MGYTADNFLENDDYWDSGDEERISSITIAPDLLTPPSQFSNVAKRNWLQEVEQATKSLENHLAFDVIPKDGKNQIWGPFDIVLSYNIEKKSFQFSITSTLTQETSLFSVDGKPIVRLANRYRESFLSRDFISAVQSNSANPAVLTEMDKQRRGYHSVAAARVMDTLKKAGLGCRYLDFAKKLFTLFQVVTPIPSRLAADMNSLYDPSLKL